jgi:hypothetical protein
MAEIPYKYLVDKENGVVDGRDFAVKCMKHAYRLLGAYADDDPETYRKLIHVTQVIAQTELAMERDSDTDPEIPDLMIVVEENDPAKATGRFQKHLVDTAQATRNLITMAEGSGA